MNANTEAVIRARLLETGKTLPDEKIAELVRQIDAAGKQAMAFIGEAALDAERNQSANYSPSQHLRVITGATA